MTRSRRKHSIRGVTGKSSEKHDKQEAHRIYRHALRRAVKQDPEKLPQRAEFCEPWDWAKDGKFYFGKRDRPELLRK